MCYFWCRCIFAANYGRPNPGDVIQCDTPQFFTSPWSVADCPQFSLYADGVLDSAWDGTSYGSPAPQSPITGSVGTIDYEINYGYYFDGSTSEVAIYDYALSSGQIEEHYQVAGY